MKSQSEFYRAALASYLRNPPQNNGDIDAISKVSEGDFNIRLDTCPSFKALQISLNDALSRLKVLDECSRLDALVPCSNDECPMRRKLDTN